MQHRSGVFLTGEVTTVRPSLARADADMPPFAMNSPTNPHGNGTFVPTPRGAFPAWDGSSFAQPPLGMGVPTHHFAAPSGNLSIVVHPNQAFQYELHAQQQQIESLTASVTRLITQTNLLLNTRHQAPVDALLL